LEKQVSTASTKRARKKAQENWGAKSTATAKRRPPSETLPPSAASEISERAWVMASLAVLAAATALRVYALDLKPMHHDEGVNGFFLTSLLRQGVYHYDPTNYHGPTLYYFSLPVVALAGLNTFAIRFVTAAFGIGTVWLVLALRRHLGSVGALVAAALVAVSPGCVFYSRYFIHESLFVFFTLGIVVAALRFYETGAATYLLLASASAALLFATKETAFISVVTLGLAALVSWAWMKLTGDAAPASNDGRRRVKDGGKPEEGWAKFLAGGQAGAYFMGALALFAFLWVLFYSSFFKNWHGVFWDSFMAFDFWGKTGLSEFHSKPIYTYVKWLSQEEAPILLLACAGAGIALFERRKNRFAVFAGAWAFGLLAAYSLISYKTPWLVLSFLVPLAIVGGYAVQALDRLGPVGAKGRAPALVVAGVAIAACTYQTFVLNFRQYDNDQYPYVYSHTQRQALDLLDEIERAARRADTKEPGVSVTSPDYWPLPWYFRDNTHVAYESQVAAHYDPQTTLAVIGREDQLPQLQRVLGENYERVGSTYPLRPGVSLVLFERRDLIAR
jgi:uncharacterized protein (TIGR03663 family)